MRGGVDAQRVLGRDPLAPRDAVREFVDVVFVAVRAVRNLDEHALCEPAFQVERHHLDRVAFERDTTARLVHPRLRQDAFDLFGEQRFDAGGTRHKEWQGHGYIALRNCVGAIFSASRYFATVRRAT